MALVLAAVVIVFVVNNLLPSLSHSQWELLDTVPRGDSAGGDFRLGIYNPAILLRDTGNPYTIPLPYSYIYPPLVAAAGIPLSYLPLGLAYRLHVLGLTIAAMASMVLVADAARRTIPSPLSAVATHRTPVTIGVFGAVAFMLVSSYGFTFALERGNYDAYALLLATLALWLMVGKRRGAEYAAIVAVAAAAHLKVYPAALFIPIIWRYGWRLVPHMTVAGLGLLFVTGVPNAFRFFQSLTSYPISVNDHNQSAYSFGNMLAQHYGWNSIWLVAALTAIPVLIFVTGMLLLALTRTQGDGLLWAFALALPLMAVVPAISHDYKLIILFPAISILLFHLVMAPRVPNGLLLATLAVAGVICRSPNYLSWGPWANKYPAVVLLQLLVLAAIFLLSRVASRGLGTAEESAPASVSGEEI
ncbi:MAG: glycosyltransferase 87 family protein [Coriobacteriia bacterium]|nr:glycosyltransferase 87 family protein [Coriobacteriia bacterium]